MLFTKPITVHVGVVVDERAKNNNPVMDPQKPDCHRATHFGHLRVIAEWLASHSSDIVGPGNVTIGVRDPKDMPGMLAMCLNVDAFITADLFEYLNTTKGIVFIMIFDWKL